MTLDEIAARAEAATEGPWDWENLTSTDAKDKLGTFGIYSLEQNDQGDLPPIAGYEDGGIVCADAEFIAHAREDVPALVAVEAVHVPWDSEEFYNGHDGESRSTIKYYCGTCVDGDERPYSWPCPTITAICEALGS